MGETAGVPGLDLPALNVVGTAASYGVDAHEAHTTDEVIKLVESGMPIANDLPLSTRAPYLSTPKSLAPCGIERVLGRYERLQSHPPLIPDESPLVRGESYESPQSPPSLRACCQPRRKV